MNANPYEPPTSAVVPAPDPVFRDQALRAFRMALVILTVPAIANYAAFDFFILGSRGFSSHVLPWFRTVNILSLLLGFAALWQLGLPLLEVIAQSIRLVSAKHADSEEWMVPVYLVLRSLVGAAVAGALLWLAWVIAIYFGGVNFYLVSWSMGLPAALLVGMLFLPLVRRWRSLALSRQ